jgi:hypothetical protein
MFSKNLMDPFLKWGKPHKFGAGVPSDTGIIITAGGEGFTKVLYRFTCSKCGKYFDLVASSDPELVAPVSIDGKMTDRFGCTS